MFHPSRAFIFTVTLLGLTACGSGSDSPADFTAPVISLNGDSHIRVAQGNRYIEPGATAVDDTDGNISVIISGQIDTSIRGEYTLTYQATDAAGNSASVSRTILVDAFKPFITTWKTNGYGASDTNQVRIGTAEGDYDYSIEWGDGSSDTHVNGDITHTYASTGVYSVSISGTFAQLYFVTGLVPNAEGVYVPGSDYGKLQTVEQWGDVQWQSMEYAFAGVYNLTINATDVPDLTSVKSISHVFDNAQFFTGDLSHWDVSNVTDMSWAFCKTYDFTSDLSLWDVSNVTDMSAMFTEAFSFNSDLSNWDVSNVTLMSGLFSSAIEFTSDLSQWDVSNVTEMNAMFSSTSQFESDLSEWDVSNVTMMEMMFGGASSFNADLSRWNVANVTSMRLMFANARIFNSDISQWDVSNVTNTQDMFSNAKEFSGDLSSWDVSQVTNMRDMFSQATHFNGNISNWDVSNVTDMENMFNGVTIPTDTYDAILNTWSGLVLQPDVIFDAGDSHYSSNGRAARQSIITHFSWTIEDEGI